MRLFGPGDCIGESSLVVPCTRVCTAVALEPTILLRLTHASLCESLSNRPKVWRELRNAVIWREPSELTRLPVLRALVGTHSEVRQCAAARLNSLRLVLTPSPALLLYPCLVSAHFKMMERVLFCGCGCLCWCGCDCLHRWFTVCAVCCAPCPLRQSTASVLAPLTDLFRFTCLADVANAPVLQPHPSDVDTATTNAAAVARMPGCFTKHSLAGPDLNSLLLIASGSAVMTVAGGVGTTPPGNKPLQVASGDWLNASTLCRNADLGKKAQVPCPWLSLCKRIAVQLLVSHHAVAWIDWMAPHVAPACSVLCVCANVCKRVWTCVDVCERV